ncbi:inhibitor of apoptosis-promotor Bax1 [Gregarina niphandrodes]|uniref:Inhibitor of apoptosis-promotor Bax1 n=1 Tax=Gregarina niphandrodes TaxID=110365 RepID=A0A023B1N9_GRENI|nr:inhibitor of apoptosis-promotor Bax1 [Gregarina niphandrodes]EZG48585.1 inhibitor of apoptosis-promotor Bax1 [Gregarina niphandrodes]|eukprot:XP_011132089.1 inhibitor of apoptosis-promotor Bax1 [Gregarina niphandrodes]
MYDEQYETVASKIDARIRRDLIRKVFTTVCYQLLATASIVAATVYLIPAVLVARNLNLMMTFAGGAWGVLWLLFTCCPSLSRNQPSGNILLGVVTLIQSLLLSGIVFAEVVGGWRGVPQVYGWPPSLSAYDIGSRLSGGSGHARVLMVLVGTIAAVIGATGAAHGMRHAPFRWYHALMVGSLCFTLLGLLKIIFLREHVAWIAIVEAGLAGILFCAYLVFDVWRLLKKGTPDVDNHVFLTMAIYMDIIYLFIELLRMLAEISAAAEDKERNRKNRSRGRRY